MSSAGGRPSRQKMVSVRTSIVPPGPRPLPADTPDASTATTTPQVTASLHDFAVSLTLTGARQFCAIRSYLSTAAKHGLHFFDALTMLTEGQPWMPAAAA